MTWYHEKCPNPDCNSSDAFSHQDGDVFGYCFSCGHSAPLDGSGAARVGKRMPPSVVSNGKRQLTIEEISTFPEGDVLERKITELVVSHFGLRVQYGREGQIEKHFYPYTKKGKVVAYKCRTLPKTFTTIGNFKNVELFNQANCAGNKKLIITEGELDAMAVAQAQYSRYKRFYPVVSLPSAAATEALIRELEFIRSYEQVILAFDMDEPGRAAVDKAARIIGFERVRIANLPSKDPCEVLLEHGPEALMQVLFDAKAYNPAGIVSGETIWETFKNHKAKVSIPYPSCLSGLNMRIKGMRLGEIVLFTSGTGCGKSTVVKEIAYHLLQTTEVHVGLAALEESVGDTAEKFIGIALNHSLSNEDDQPTEEELREAFDSVFGSERLILLDHQGSVADESLSEKIEQLALMGCSHIFLDHITIAVSEGTEGNQGGNEAIDAVMSDLLKIVKRNNIWLGIVSHLRKTPVTIKKSFEEGRMPSLDDIKGSGSIKQIAFDVVAFARNTTAESEEERSRTQLCVLKSRYTGNTGLAGEYTYSAETGRISLVDIDDFA